MESTCFVCLDGEDEQPFIHPGCHCTGTNGFVHESCLQKTIDAFASSKCRTCNHSFAVFYPLSASIASLFVWIFHAFFATLMSMTFIGMFTFASFLLFQTTYGWSWIMGCYGCGVFCGFVYIVNERRQWRYEEFKTDVQQLFLEHTLITTPTFLYAIYIVAQLEQTKFLSKKGRVGKK